MSYPHDQRTLSLHELWRSRLAEARIRYEADPGPETKRTFLRVLSQFTGLVLRGEIPAESENGSSAEGAGVA